MSTKTGFYSNGGTPFAYLEDSNGKSVAIGIDSADSDKIKISALATVGATPASSPQITIDPATNGNITIDPNGTGAINANATAVVTTGGVVQAAITTGALSASKGTNGQILIGSTAGTPSWANVTSTGGTVSVTNGANTINLEVATGTGVVKTITGNTGGAISPTAGNINIVTANSTAKFAGSGSTETLDFGLSSLALGSSLASATGSVTQTVAIGQAALNSVQFDGSNVAIGYHAMNVSTDSSNNVAIGSNALKLYNALGGSGGFNTAVGENAGGSLGTGGSNNTMLGARAGFNFLNTETDNICINSQGIVGDVSTLRIGASTGLGAQQLNKAYICGIDGVNVGSVSKVVTMASDQLGTATLTAGTGISITPSANTITIGVTGPSAFTWNEVTGTSASMAVNNGYIANNAGLVTLTLPATAVVGDTIKVMYKGTGGWKIAQNSGQTIRFGNQNTTTGTGGSLQNSQVGDGIELVCITANTDWRNVVGSQGNITVT